MDSIDEIRSELDRLETFVADLEDERDALKAKVDSAEQAAAGVRSLAESVRLYFSWLEHPPKDMEPKTYEALLANFRHDVEQSLREVGA